ncbi:MAG: hypothetical protein KJ574_03260, partial [Nanoarchaeota archaeon]|nr:hypothetical protein [Nanoarchaeota archaeon]
ETATWPSDLMMYDVDGYAWMKDNLAAGTKVGILCSTNDDKGIGMNMKGFSGDAEVQEFKKQMMNKSPEEIYTFTKRKGYQYVMVDAACINLRQQTVEQMNALLINISAYPGFKLHHQTQASWLFEIE